MLIHSRATPVIASAAKRSTPALRGALDPFVAAAKRQFILSAAAGGVEGLPAMTERAEAA